ncbi:hypothetical protein ACJMK2_017682 [Sinanodonta woodiana]|uniref:BTB domain-containing protein n=1 Tax=Sinanodonta woodiana TaxID=1069815 RepID=A0ABD3UCP6_SINWO
MNRLRKKHQLCDVILKVQGKEFHVHKTVLAASSDYFLAMFSSNLSEKTQSVIELHEMESDVFEKVIEFVYTAEITLTTANVQDLLHAACLLMLKGIQLACSTFLQKELDPSNCLGIMKFAERYSVMDLHKAAHVFCQYNFKEVVKHTEFLNLTMPELAPLLDSDYLRCDEETVYEAAIKWMKHDPRDRKEHLCWLMRLVRLPQLTARYLTDVMDNQMLLKRCFRCRDLLDEAKNFHLRPELQCQMRRPWFYPRTGIEDVLVVIGGFGKDCYLDRAELYRPKTDKWIQIPNLSTNRRYVSAAAVGSVLYAIGGYDGKRHLNTVECMDFSGDELVWKPVASMKYKRGLAGVTVHADMVYICGGKDGNVRHKSMERYRPVENRWEVIGDLSLGRDGMALTQAGDSIYFIGGFDGINALDNVERFDVMKSEFSTLHPMISKRSAPGVAVMDNMIYACGGYDDIEHLTTVERYDIVADQWTCLRPMKRQLCYAVACVLNEKLLLVAGYNGESLLNTVDSYNPETDTWRTREAEMSLARSDPGVAVVRASLHWATRKDKPVEN